MLSEIPRSIPHGDASIGDAMIQLGQKDLLIDIRGNWGNLLTGILQRLPDILRLDLHFRFGSDFS